MNSASDEELLRTIETNFAALSNEDQDQTLALLADRERRLKEKFEEAFEDLFERFIANKSVPDECWREVVQGIERARLLREMEDEEEDQEDQEEQEPKNKKIRSAY